MIFDFARNEAVPPISADVCIVGAGAAGIVLAVELAGQGKRVLLLESGGSIVEPEPQLLNDCSYSGQPHQGANIGRFRVLGGTTTAWGGQILEMDAEDFGARDWVPGSGWPFPKTELRPYYERALQAEGLSRSLREDDDVWRRLKLTPPNFGDEFTAYFTRWCPEPDFSRLHRSFLESSKVSVFVHATAVAILLSENGSAVRGIACRNSAGKERIFSAGKYILSLGTIESIRFLMQPLPEGQPHPWNQSGLLGCHFQSHIDINAASVPAEDAGRLRPWFATAFLDGAKYHPKFRLSFPQQMREQILSIGGSVTCISLAETELRRMKALARNLLQRREWSGRWKDAPAILRQIPTLLQLAYGFVAEHRAAWPENSLFWLRAYCEQEPLSRSCIRLTNIRDAVGMFQVEWDWHISSLEWKTIRRFTELATAAFDHLGLAKISPRPELFREDGFRDLVLDDSHHHMGGARMAPNAALGVVDANLKLYGVENAYLCSAAVFPSSGFSNPTHTLVALAVRLAEHLNQAQSHA